MDEVLAVARARPRVPLGLGMPDLFHLEQPPIASTHVVLSELQRRAPPGPLELTTVGLREDGTVLALAQEALTLRGEGSTDHAAILNDAPCGTSVPIACELRAGRCEFAVQSWGQHAESVCELWAQRSGSVRSRG